MKTQKHRTIPQFIQTVVRQMVQEELAEARLQSQAHQHNTYVQSVIQRELQELGIAVN